MVINRLPAEYQEVEYLESTGTQWIATDYIEQAKTSKRAELTYKRLANYSDDSMFYGYSTGGRSSYFEYHPNTYFGIGGSRWRTIGQAGTICPLNVKRKIVLQEDKALIYDGYDDNLLATILPNSTQSTDVQPIVYYIFAWNSAGNAAHINRGARIYDLAFYEDDVLTRHFIPCYRKTDQEPGMYDTVTNQFFTNSGTGTFLVGNDVNYSTVNLMESRRRILLNTPHIKSLSGNALSFKTDVPFTLKECKIHFSPVQEGEGTPSPENVRPITGWDGVTVTACGKNLFDKDNVQALEAWLSGTKISQSGSDRVIYISCLPNTVYSISKAVGGVIAAGYTTDLPMKSSPYYGHVRNSSNTTTVTITTGSDAKYLVVWVYDRIKPANKDLQPEDIYDSLQIELGSEVTDYEPYQAITLTIPFPQTVYGGYVDLVKGEVVEEWVKTTIGSDWVLQNSTLSVFQKIISGKKPTTVDSELISDSYGIHTTLPVTQLNQLPDLNICGRQTYNRIFLRDTRFANVEDFESAMSSSEFCYTLATPNTLPLADPPSIPSTLRGLNNILTNANGNIDVSFYAH